MEEKEVKIKNKKSQQRYFKIARVVVAFITVIAMVWLVNKFIFRSRATQDVATISFSPKLTHVAKNQVFSQTVQLNSGEKKISAIDLTLIYDNTKLQYVPNSTDLLLKTLPANYFTKLILEKETAGSNNRSKVRIVLIANKSEADLNNNLVISVQFKALEVTNSTQLTLNEPESIVVGTTGTDDSLDHTYDINSVNALSTIIVGDAISCASDAQCGTNAQCANSNTCTCKNGFYNCDNDWFNGCESANVCEPTGGIKLQFALKLQGINSDPIAARKLKFKVMVVGTHGNRQGPKEVELTISDRKDGVFEGEADFEKLMPEQNFKIFVKGPKHVQKRYCDILPAGGTDYYCNNDRGFELKAGVNKIDLTQSPLLAGDLPLPEQDGILNSKDIVALRNCIKDRTDECTVQTDVNYDGVTNGTDFTIVLNSMGIKYDDEN